MAKVDTGVDVVGGGKTIYIHANKIEYDVQKMEMIDVQGYNAPTGVQEITRTMGDLGLRNTSITIYGFIDVNSENTASDASDAKDDLLTAFNNNNVATIHIEADTFTVMLLKLKIMWAIDDSATKSTPPGRYDIVLNAITSTYL